MDEERRYLEALARDDRSAFDALYLKYAAKTEEFLYRMLKDHSEAEDITQDIFLKIWRNRTSIGAVDAFGPYLFRMAREEGLSNDQIAEQLSISRRTVENQISRALAELRKLVKLILFFF